MEHLETFSWIDFIAHALGVHIPPQLEHVAMTWVVMILLVVPSFLLTRRLKRTPGAGQNILEFLVEMLQDFLESMMGPKGKRYLPLIGALTLFILFSNLLGLVPGFYSPTHNINTTAACALVVFFSTHIIGIREQGLRRYLRHFAGPVWWLAPIMVPVEVIGHLGRPLSLSVRLFGNIFGEDAVRGILFSLVPLLLPLPMMVMGLFASVVQTFVFVMLSTLYIAGAQETDHPEETVPSPERKE